MQEKIQKSAKKLAPTVGLFHRNIWWAEKTNVRPAPAERLVTERKCMFLPIFYTLPPCVPMER